MENYLPLGFCILLLASTRAAALPAFQSSYSLFSVSQFGSIQLNGAWYEVHFLSCGWFVTSCRHWHTVVVSEQRDCLRICKDSLGNLLAQIAKHKTRIFHLICSSNCFAQKAGLSALDGFNGIEVVDGGFEIWVQKIILSYLRLRLLKMGCSGLWKGEKKA